jgi:hypothetical protein
MTFGQGCTRRAVRQTVDDLPKLDVHRLYRAGLLPAGTRLVLAVGGEEQTIGLARRPGTLGGEVVLFCCPRCESRRGHLYLRAGTFACRACYRLTYATKLEHVPALLLRARALRRRIGAENLQPFSPLPPRAPRRGWAALNYDKLAGEIAACEVAVIGALAALNDAADKRRKGYRRDRHKRGRIDDA